MLSKVLSYGIQGINGYQVTVEVNISRGMPAFEVVGLPDAAVRESRERVRAALTNAKMGFPSERITVNLAPADTKKEGPAYDLPIALGMLMSMGRLPAGCADGSAVFGELSLDGGVHAVRGALPMVISAKEHGVARVILPTENVGEVRCVEGIEIIPVCSLAEAARHLSGEITLAPVVPENYTELVAQRDSKFDFRFVKGQHAAKRALEIAAAGGHNVLMVGSPGSGKTLMARCVPSILPDMTFEEALEVTRIHSVSGGAVETGLFTERPFRSPHHTASHAAIVGGGIGALPGEASKAHNGVLFLDELPEYSRDVLEALRQPLEDGFVSIARVAAQATYPARFMMVCSMNPCPCGYLGSRQHDCRCSQADIRRYHSKVSGPLLDRIDIHINVESISHDEISAETDEEPSCDIRARVQAARDRQTARYEGTSIRCNAQLDARTLTKACPMDRQAKQLAVSAADNLGLSNRAYTRVIKVARTIADLDNSDIISQKHISEAIQFRSMNTKYW